ncbi:hypothetical protein WUBG_12066 [Wuchereria bancrofti]|uniref:Uncharacterized protein n=1 Tax=Wuchereria bancrofti TaxID=6293 RepID=J9E4H0_WUCBA|nr:hypothetical protein WUBG_12066 [Wuchereria bancrofti]
MSRRAVGEKHLSHRLDCANDLLNYNMLTAVVTDDTVAESINKLPQMSKVYCATTSNKRAIVGIERKEITYCYTRPPTTFSLTDAERDGWNYFILKPSEEYGIRNEINAADKMALFVCYSVGNPLFRVLPLPHH